MTAGAHLRRLVIWLGVEGLLALVSADVSACGTRSHRQSQFHAQTESHESSLSHSQSTHVLTRRPFKSCSLSPSEASHLQEGNSLVVAAAAVVVMMLDGVRGGIGVVILSSSCCWSCVNVNG